MKKVALITGASRGIGENIVHKLASLGYNIVIAAKSTDNIDNKGSIYSVQKDIEKYNIESLAVPLDLRNLISIESCIEKIDKKFNRLDILINNAGALCWESIDKISEKKYNLINNINCKGTFYLSKFSLSLMKQNNFGHIINHSPPLIEVNNINTYKNKTAYMISKYGMTMVALGIAAENKNNNIAANTLWPRTAIDTDAVRINKLGTKKNWRKPTIISDAIEKIILEDPSKFTGNQLIDEDYLRSKGVNDFNIYQSMEGYEPVPLDMLFNNSKFNI